MSRSLFLVLAAISLSSNYPFLQTDTDLQRFISVKFESMHQVSNNGVGHEWTNFLSVNHQIIKESEKVIFKLEKQAPLTIEAHAIEKDTHHDDLGNNDMTLTYTDLIAIEKSRFEIRIKVMENGGQRAGNLAEWRYIFELAREEKMQ